MRNYLLTLLLIAILPIVAIAQNSDKNYVVIVSLDGFRHDYPELYNAENILKIAEKGVRVERLIPSNPTKTFPNHYTLATGLYPDHHGIIGNSFFDVKLKKKYALGDKETVGNGEFYGGEPIWNTVEKAGLKAATYNWVGSEADIQGMRPSIWKEYDGSVTFEQKIDSAITWLNRPEPNRPRLVMLYHSEPDHSGHVYGPNSKEVEKQVHYTDKQIGNLHRRLMQLPIAKNINFILVSDHGMRSISKERVVLLENYLKDDWIEGVYGGNPVYTIKAKPGKTKQVYNTLKKIKHLKVYLKGKAPKSLHIANHPNTGDMIVFAEKGYSVFYKIKFGADFGGTHGYINTDKQMAAVFVAQGNMFRKGFTKTSIRNVDVYNLMTYILGISPAKNDGNCRRIKPLLKAFQ